MQNTAGIDKTLRIALAVCALAFVAVVAKAVYVKPIHVVVAGERAPDFTVRTDDGKTVSLKNFGGKVLLLNFWASWCGPCVEETPSLSRLAKDYSGRGLVVLGISVDASEKAYQSFLQKYRPGFLTVREGQIHREYGTFMYPETYIIDASGKVVQKIEEAADWSQPNVRSFIESLL